MPTTTNFGWTTPADTDLVKDGAAAIRTLAGNIDTSLVDLKGGTTGQVLAKASNTDLDYSWVAQDDSNAIQNALLTTTGDTIYASAASTPARLGLGTAGQVLQVNSGATAPEWATIAAGGMTLINTGGTTFANGTNTISSIPATYQNLFIVIEDWFPFDNAAWIQMRFNSDSTASRHDFNSAISTSNGTFTLTNARMSPAQSNSAPGTSLTTITIPNYANTTTWKYAVSQSLTNNNTTNSNYNFAQYHGLYNQIGAISSLQFSTGVSNTFGSGQGLSGTIYVYGVK
jgi:hypothetical protein